MFRNRAWCHFLLVVLGTACGSSDSPSRLVSGTVTGAWSFGVMVTLVCADPVVEMTTLTDDQGRFAFPSVPVTACTVTPRYPRYRFDPASAEVTADPASPSSFDFVAYDLAQPRLQVRGTDIVASHANVDVRHAGHEVEDAVVRVNGQVVPFLPATGVFSGPLIAALSVGDPISLEVTGAGATVTGTGLLPEAPVLTTADAHFSSSGDLVVNWTSTTSPDSFTVNADWSCGTACGTGIPFEVPGSARSFTIPRDALPSGEIKVSVFAYNDGVLWGDYEPAESYPGMNIRNASDVIVVAF